MGQLLSQKKTVQEKKAGMPINIAKAVARISGGLYVVTAMKGASKGAMIASWVSQVSVAFLYMRLIPYGFYG